MKAILLLALISLGACGATPTPSQPIEVIPPPISAAPTKEAVTKLVLTPSGTVNKFGNPIYKLTVIVSGVVMAEFETVAGRAHTQSKNRHVAGTEAPPPNGRYRVNRYARTSSEHEVGGKFLDITPLFNTGRSALGFHVDPSFEKNRKEDGTAGCIATTTVADRDLLYKLISRYNIQLLEVSI
jgi:hypothetical protein